MATSYNGCPASQDPTQIGVDPNFYVPWNGSKIIFPGGIGQTSDFKYLMKYYITQFFNRVEKPYALQYNIAGFWGWQYRPNVNNPTVLSCHSSASAADINAVKHPNGVSGTFSSSQYKTIGIILDTELEGMLTVGIPGLKGPSGRLVGWTTSSRPDEMHVEASKYDPSNWTRVANKLRQQGEDMGLTAEDKTWIQQTIADALTKFNSKDKITMSKDEMSNPDTYDTTRDELLKRAVRLESISASRITGRHGNTALPAK